MSEHTPGPWAWDDKVPSDYDKADWSEVAPWLCSENGEPVLTGQIACKNPVDVCLIAAAPELIEALRGYEAAMNMPIYGDYSDFVFPEIKPRAEGDSAWGNICAKHGLSYGGGCICCRGDFNNHKERKDYLARCARDDALRVARNKARAVIAKATGGSDV
jgi:hypothetical protein